LELEMRTPSYYGTTCKFRAVAIFSLKTAPNFFGSIKLIF